MGMGHKNDRIGELNSFWLIIDQLAVAFYETIPTEVLMIIEGEFHQNFVFVCPLYTLVNFACFLSSAFFLNISEIPPECQTVWIQIRPDILLPVHVT